MTGYLQRLAERATGAVAPLRRVAAPLFAPSLVEAVPSLADPAETTMAAATVERASAPARQAAAQRVPSAGDGAGGPGTAPERRGGVPGSARETPLDDSATGRSAGALPRTLMPAGRDLPPAPAGPLGSGIGSGMGPGSRTASSHQSTQGPDTDPHDRPWPVPAAVPAVEPLLPRTRSAPAPDRPYPAASRPDRAGDAPGAVQETTEVHISIGRIEVTAVHEPAPARPAAPRRTAPLSLDEYLAKRHGVRT